MATDAIYVFSDEDIASLAVTCEVAGLYGHSIFIETDYIFPLNLTTQFITVNSVTGGTGVRFSIPAPLTLSASFITPDRIRHTGTPRGTFLSPPVYNTQTELDEVVTRVVAETIVQNDIHNIHFELDSLNRDIGNLSSSKAGQWETYVLTNIADKTTAKKLIGLSVKNYALKPKTTIDRKVRINRDR